MMSLDSLSYNSVTAGIDAGSDPAGAEGGDARPVGQCGDGPVRAEGDRADDDRRHRPLDPHVPRGRVPAFSEAGRSGDRGDRRVRAPVGGGVPPGPRAGPGAPGRAAGAPARAGRVRALLRAAGDRGAAAAAEGAQHAADAARGHVSAAVPGAGTGAQGGPRPEARAAAALQHVDRPRAPLPGQSGPVRRRRFGDRAPGSPGPGAPWSAARSRDPAHGRRPKDSGEGGAMLDHLGVKVKDLASSRRFYTAALAPLGFTVQYEDEAAVAFGPQGAPAFWLGQGEPRGSAHIAFAAKDRAAVKAFHAAAVPAGGKDNGGL